MTAQVDRRELVSFASYTDAERAVEYLAQQGFPVEHVSIVGHDLRLVENVTGRVGYPQAVLRGAGGGALTGALIGWVFGWFDWLHPLIASVWLAFDGLVFGAIVGAVFGLIVHALQSGRRDFDSTSSLRPTRYELIVDSEVADQAEYLLAQAPWARRT
jgi:hypothetical protein